MEHSEIYLRAATILHLVGVILGVGSATVTDIFFFRFISDKHISASEAKLMDILTKIIWAALAVLIVTGIMLYISNMDRLNESGKFLTKLVGLLVLVLNGMILGRYIRPRLTKIDFSNNNMSRFGLSHEVNRKMRIYATLSGAVSIASWYFIFILGALRGITFPFSYGITAYIFILVLAACGSLIFESGIHKKIQRKLQSH